MKIDIIKQKKMHKMRMAIRPTYIDIEPDSIKDSLTNDQYKLYKLVYNRFLASQMAPAVYDTMNVNIKANAYDFKANGQVLKFKGFMTLYVESTDKVINPLNFNTCPFALKS